MPPPPEHTVTSLTDFTELIEQSLALSRTLYGPNPSVINWYRGCGLSNTHKLLPSLYRHPGITASAELLSLERKMLEWFKRESVLHETITQYIDPAEPELELLFFMQHYSVPTRLLDWTMNPYIALYFAVTGAKVDESTGGYVDDAAVWILNPNAWNEQSLAHVSWGPKGALSIEDVERRGYAPLKELDPVHVAGMYAPPAAMRGIANSSRMFAQKGVFTIFGRDTNPMEVAFDVNGYQPASLTKLIIDKSHITTLMDSVLSIGYTDSVSYPDLHGLAMEMRRTFGFKV